MTTRAKRNYKVHLISRNERHHSKRRRSAGNGLAVLGFSTSLFGNEVDDRSLDLGINCNVTCVNKIESRAPPYIFQVVLKYVF